MDGFGRALMTVLGSLTQISERQLVVRAVVKRVALG
jgi:hypothetical protein